MKTRRPYPKNRKSPRRIIPGQRFAKLTTLKLAGYNERRTKTLWLCQCDCGKTTIVAAGHLSRTQSCGCSNGTHHMSYGRTFRSWVSLFQRCENPKDQAYADYGGRGIKICPQWRRFEQFLKDMGERPPGLTLDRRDNDGDYTPENCRWSTRQVQSENRRSVVWIEFNGARKTVAQWARDFGMDPGVLRFRLKSNWPFEKAATLPLHSKIRAA